MTPDSLNEARAPAYALGDRGALAQLACTGMLQPVFYASVPEQRGWLVYHGARVEPQFLARTALYARQQGFLRETPALLCALLSQRGGALLEQIFHPVIDSGPMLRKFVGHLRSGALGRRSLGRRPRRLIHEWFERRSDDQILAASVGNQPSLADVLRLAHVSPHTPSRRALFGYLLGRQLEEQALPPLVRALRQFQSTGEGEVPDVPFRLLTASSPTAAVWAAIARHASWTTARMNLNTFARHGVLEDGELVETLAARLADPAQVERARAMPYQLMTALHNLDAAVPALLRDALDQALDLSLRNVPSLPGRVHVCVDISGSMHQPLSTRGQTRCLDVAALFAAALLRKNPEATLLTFDTSASPVDFQKHERVMTLASRISSTMGGGTDCGAPVRWLDERGWGGELVVLISDQESWVASTPGWHTSLMTQWSAFRAGSPQARLVCLDLQPYRTIQAPPSWDVLHVGGFSDEVFSVLGRFLQGRLGPEAWVQQIEALPIDVRSRAPSSPGGNPPSSGMRS